MSEPKNNERLRRYWDKHARSYDRQMRFLDRRRLFGESRSRVCSQTTGDVLEVAIGTELNLPFHPPGVRLTGIEWSPQMLAIARRRAEELGRTAGLREADAQALPFPDAAFDTVVCTLSLYAIPDDQRAVAEMSPVLKPGGRLLLLDHIASSAWPVRAIQRSSKSSPSRSAGSTSCADRCGASGRKDWRSSGRGAALLAGASASASARRMLEVRPHRHRDRGLGAGASQRSYVGGG
ncbi:hypothetical protein SSP24_41640 [Streptomyces spinoverrucosus]|uniref:Methyltransferase type 11 domain-containing protein n=1 Tax=Streptomyces spinoverrucosus TaxID=284043 RepID=A0A4Y3VLK4_9ACTN|nr:methyltransferase domain-containing protein [Streptomyces spinoverrucosus]GEC06509.1 hypothetical protein SSP24_41640 [Streptomyces spinoverrucosus]GHB54665.1 hypothetical protein GCM10010397_26210 [Streptomyces spinoverrucosus]